MTSKRKSTGGSRVQTHVQQGPTLASVFDKVTRHTDKAGREICDLFWELPSKQMYPDYYVVIKHPISLEQIQKKIQNGLYASPQDFMVDVELLVENACTYNIPQSQVFKDAKEIVKMFKKAIGELGTSAFSVPSTAATTPIDQVAKKFNKPLKDLAKIYDALVSIEKKEYRLCGLFEKLPDKTVYPDYYQLIKQPIALDMIKKNIDTKTYKTVEDMERDIILMVSNAKTFNVPQSMVFKDADLILKSFYEITGRELDESKLREELTEFTHQKVKYSIGDFVYLYNDLDKEKPSIAQIQEIWKLSSGQIFFKGLWYLHPEQTVHPATRRFYKNEVFKSERSAEHLCSEALGKCFVLHVKDYVRGNLVDAKGRNDDVYVCESRYIEAGKKMDRIKNWKTTQPEAVRDKEWDFEPAKPPILLEKFPSPFAHLVEDVKESNETSEADMDSGTESEYSDDKHRSSKKQRRVSGVIKDPIQKPIAFPPHSIPPLSANLQQHGAPMNLPHGAMRLHARMPQAPVDALKPAEQISAELVKQFDHRNGHIKWFAGPSLFPISHHFTVGHSFAYQKFKREQEDRNNEKMEVDSVQIVKPQATTSRRNEQAPVNWKPHCESLLQSFADQLVKESKSLSQLIHDES